jgi:hypothetical protein
MVRFTYGIALMASKLSTKAKIVAGLASEMPNCENMSVSLGYEITSEHDGGPF